MQITLMRHGPPMLATSGWLAPCDLGRWIAAYDRSTVTGAVIPAGSMDAARAAVVVFSSTLPRSVSSAFALGHPSPRIDALFREAALPFSPWRIPCLPPRIWAALLRLAWLSGYARGVESLTDARLRADAASTLLIACAADGPVLLLGHGVMNRLIARELRARGWTAATAHGNGYWGSVTFASP